MNTITQQSKFQKLDNIVTSYLNGNISWVRAEVKKLNKATRKELYVWVKEGGYTPDTISFFFNLI